MAIAPAVDQAALAGHGRRLSAALLDGLFGLIVIGACGAAGFGLGLLAGGDTRDDSWESLGWILLGSVVGVGLGIALWLALTVWLVRRPGRHNGQTLGKQCLAIRAARADGRDIGVGWAMLREILAKGLLIGATSSLISTFMGFVDAGLGGGLAAVCVWYAPALFDEQRRGLHDHLCSTRVVLAGRRGAQAAPAAGEDLWATTR